MSVISSDTLYDDVPQPMDLDNDQEEPMDVDGDDNENDYGSDARNQNNRNNETITTQPTVHLQLTISYLLYYDCFCK